MTTLLAVLLLFVLAFAGMALGSMLGRRTLRSGCGGADTKSGCHCSTREQTKTSPDS